MRTSYVQLDGVLYRKEPDGSVLRDGEKWGCFGGKWMPWGSASSSHMVMPDIQPYISTITGEVIPSRSRHREHLRAHDCIEVGNERPQPRREEWTATKGLREELAARLFG